MKKLRLEDLNVESFSTASLPQPRGTVRAAEDLTIPFVSLCSECRGTCGQTCDEYTCAAYQAHSCYDCDSAITDLGDTCYGPSCDYASPCCKIQEPY